MIKAEVQWLQRNDLTRLDHDARYAAELSNLIGLTSQVPQNWLIVIVCGKTCYSTYKIVARFSRNKSLLFGFGAPVLTCFRAYLTFLANLSC